MVLEGNCPAEFNSIPIQTPKKKKKSNLFLQITATVGVFDGTKLCRTSRSCPSL